MTSLMTSDFLRHQVTRLRTELEVLRGASGAAGEASAASHVAAEWLAAGDRDSYERSLMRADAGHAARLAALTMALEKEASAQVEWQRIADAAKAEAEGTRRQLCALQRQMERLVSSQLDDDAAVNEVAAGKLAALTPQELRRQVASQRACIKSLDEALALAQARVHLLETARPVAAKPSTAR